MSGQVIDFDIILPRYDYLTFTAHGVKYQLKLFIPCAVALLIIHKSKVIQDGGKESKEALFEIASKMFKRQYPVMTRDWLEKNLSAMKVRRIAAQVLREVGKYFEKQASEGDEKKPAHGFEFAPIMAKVMSTYHLSPSYILNEMTFPQVIKSYKEAVSLETGKREAPEQPEETEEEINAKFGKDPEWRYKPNK